MGSRNVLGLWFCVTALLLGAGAWHADSDSSSLKIIGGVEVRGGEIPSSLPQHRAEMIYVADFVLDAEHYSSEEGVRGALPGRLGQRLPHPLAKQNPTEQARKIVDTMAECLVQQLTANRLPAERLRDLSASLPQEGWLVQGTFTEVDEGNRIKRAVVGFGRGATSMDLQVAISDLSSPSPRAAFAVFGTVKDPSKIPGAVITMNPYVAAAKFVLEKNAGERDIRRTAERIAAELVKYEQQIGKSDPGSGSTSP